MDEPADGFAGGRDDRAGNVATGRQRANGNQAQGLSKRAIGAFSHFRDAALQSRAIGRIGDLEQDFRFIQRAWFAGVELGISRELPSEPSIRPEGAVRFA